MESYKILKHYSQFPNIIDNQNLFADRKFNPSMKPVKAQEKTRDYRMNLSITKQLKKKNNGHKKVDLKLNDSIEEINLKRSVYNQKQITGSQKAETPNFSIKGFFSQRFKSLDNGDTIFKSESQRQPGQYENFPIESLMRVIIDPSFAEMKPEE